MIDTALSGCARTNATADAGGPLVCSGAEVPFESVQYLLVFQVLLGERLIEASVL